MKENSSSGLSSPSTYTNWSTTEDEILVAEILLQLPTLILKDGSLSGYKFPITWGSRRKRSAHENRPSSLRSSTSPPGPLAVGSTSDADDDRPPPSLKVEASSPATPLSFSPSEPEDKPKPSKRRLHVKRKKEEWLEMIDELTRLRESLKGDVKNCTSHCEELEAFHLKLKTRKHELTLGTKMKGLSLGTDQSLNVNMELGPSPTNDRGHLHGQEIHQPPSIVKEDHAAQTRDVKTGNIQYDTANNQIPYSMVSSIGFVNNDKISRVVPDLNLSVEEFNNVTDSAQMFHLDTAAANKELMNKVMAAQARRNRIQICRVKNSIAPNKLRYR
ncbi:hypothetical protein FNV43_RR11963 [Rhamnella rubrinervis]|uniref:Uncharacterized protein n=1 Tax=Rhamnella rubrinervis TaxID=2594499 RepID=A0A8K0MIC8_9ROSA|nr:hypothetical protein FNV43_RR11963 [Rhamnella rubrinervis]